MSYRVWYSTESFADYIIDHTILSSRDVEKCELLLSDADTPEFHKIPDHIKSILYLDAPDIIVEKITDEGFEPIFSIEESREAGTGHNAFQRFSRLIAAVENNVPAFYIYPEATIIKRKNGTIRWDRINPTIFQALEEVMDTYEVPAMLFFYPTDYHAYRNNPTSSPNYINKGTIQELNWKYAGCPIHSDNEMQSLFQILNQTITRIENVGFGARNTLLKLRSIKTKRAWMRQQLHQRIGKRRWSPISACVELDTEFLINYLSKYNSALYSVSDSDLLNRRAKTIFYQVGSKFRAQGDPYTGALAAIDYIKCRTGKTFEDRDLNLVLVWGKLQVDSNNKTFVVQSANTSINNFITKAEAGERRSLLRKGYHNLRSDEIPRYYMHVRYGSTFSKSKGIRIFSYFADAILFKDGSLWRDA